MLQSVRRALSLSVLAFVAAGCNRTPDTTAKELADKTESLQRQLDEERKLRLDREAAEKKAAALAANPPPAAAPAVAAAPVPAKAEEPDYEKWKADWLAGRADDL